jgi:hypothetical protein
MLMSVQLCAEGGRGVGGGGREGCHDSIVQAQRCVLACLLLGAPSEERLGGRRRRGREGTVLGREKLRRVVVGRSVAIGSLLYVIKNPIPIIRPRRSGNLAFAALIVREIWLIFG